MKLVLKFGGSLLYTDDLELRTDVLEELAEYVSTLSRSHEVTVVIGGGKITRRYVRSLHRELSTVELDVLSIKMTQVHAYVLSRILNRHVPTNLIEKYTDLMSSSAVVNVTGGFYPGQSTNGAAATCAELVEADLLVNYFGYDHIMSADPESGEEGEPLPSISYSQLRELTAKFQQVPGHYELFDLNALNAVERSGIPVLFLNGNYPMLLDRFLRGEAVGTLIKEEGC